MNKRTIITALLTAVLALTSCHQSAQKAEAGTAGRQHRNSDQRRHPETGREGQGTDGTLRRDCHHHQSHEAGRELRRGIHHRVRDGRSVADRSLPQGFRLRLRTDHRSCWRHHHHLRPPRPTPPHPRPLPPLQTNRRQNPLRRLLHQERHQVPNRDISVGIRLTF